MRNVYNIIERITNQLEGQTLNGTTTFGDIFDIDLKKQTIFPLSHVTLTSATITGDSMNTIVMGVDVIVMDVVDIAKNDIRDIPNPIQGQDNLQDVLNSTLVIINDLVTDLARGNLYKDLYQLSTDSVVCTPFLDRFENNLAGWAVSLEVITANTEISAC